MNIHIVTNANLFECCGINKTKSQVLRVLGSYFPFSYFPPQLMDTRIMWRSDNSLTPKRIKSQDSKALEVKAIFYMVCFETPEVGPLFKDSPQHRCMKFHHQKAPVALSNSDILGTIRFNRLYIFFKESGHTN